MAKKQNNSGSGNDGNYDAEQLADFILALISDENLLTMPRIRLAYDLIDRDGARRVAAQRMKEVLAAALVQAERVEKVKLSQDTLSEAITVGDFNKDQMI